MITLPVLIGHVAEPDVVVSYITLALVGHFSYVLGHPPNLLNTSLQLCEFENLAQNSPPVFLSADAECAIG